MKKEGLEGKIFFKRDSKETFLVREKERIFPAQR